MLDILYSLDWTAIILWGIPAIGGPLLYWYRKRISEWKQFWRDVLEGLRGIPALQAEVSGISAFVGPNGAGPLMDTVKRAEAAVAVLAEQVDLIIHTMWAENDSDDDTARFHCGDRGQFTYVNQLFARWLGVGKAELLGWGWINFIHGDDADRVRRHWDTCRAEHRQCRVNFRLVGASGTAFDVRMVAAPIPDTEPAKRWIGSVRRLDNEKPAYSAE